ncbi:MAG: hypothetical protein CMM03_03905 [Rhodopirellula sp.]|nr:hypothetical protein [Rhodopirellula sp.]
MVKQGRDVLERRSFIQALKGGWKIFANRFANSLRIDVCRIRKIYCGGMVEGAFQPQWIIWVIRLTSPHLPYMGQAATGAV